MSTPHWTITGQGLAGTCLAWQLWHRGAPFTLIDREQGGSSRVAAGLINPVTGKNYEPSREFDHFQTRAIEFFAQIETLLGTQIWHPLPIIRFAANEKEWQKMQAKAQHPDVARWISHGPTPLSESSWHGSLTLHGGGRLDTRSFLDGSRDFFRQHGCYRPEEITHTTTPHTIWCDGAQGLLTRHPNQHRCAKGEILTVHAPLWDESHIRIGGGGWIVPIGHGHFKVGATYEWEQLNESPTPTGRAKLETIAQSLADSEFTPTHHEAGIRPILRRSDPFIGPIHNSQWMFNGLGSKGSLYAPNIAHQLANWLLDGTEPDSYYDIRQLLR